MTKRLYTYAGQLTTLELHDPAQPEKVIFSRVLAHGAKVRLPEDHPVVVVWEAKKLLVRGSAADEAAGPDDPPAAVTGGVQAPQADPAMAAGVVALGTEPRPDAEVGPETLVADTGAPPAGTDDASNRRRRT